MMNFITAMPGLLQSSAELGLITALVVLALYLSYTMLNICDLSTDGVVTLGAAVGAMVALSGHPFLAIFAAIGAGMLSGVLTAFLQTKMGINSLLAGIVVNTGLYSVNIFIMGNSSLVSLNKADTVFTMAKDLLKDTFLAPYSKLLVIVLFVAVAALFLTLFLRTRLGLALRATGNNPDMVRSSSVNTTIITIIGLALANGLTALSGCLLAQYNKSADINIGTGLLTVALASLLIGGMFFKKKGVGLGTVGAIIGAFLFRLIYAIALEFHMPAFLLKLISSVIVIIAIAGPYLFKAGKENIAREKSRKALMNCGEGGEK